MGVDLSAAHLRHAARVGAWHLPLADLLNAVTAAGLRLAQVAESGASGVPDLLGVLAVKP